LTGLQRRRSETEQTAGQKKYLGEEALNGSLDDISKRFERSVLTRLYRTYPSTRKLAKRLGVSHTAIANKLREYGLSSRKPDGSDE